MHQRVQRQLIKMVRRRCTNCVRCSFTFGRPGVLVTASTIFPVCLRRDDWFLASLSVLMKPRSTTSGSVHGKTWRVRPKRYWGHVNLSLLCPFLIWSCLSGIYRGQLGCRQVDFSVSPTTPSTMVHRSKNERGKAFRHGSRRGFEPEVGHAELPRNWYSPGATINFPKKEGCRQ